MRGYPGDTYKSKALKESHSAREMMEFFLKAHAEKAEHDQRTLENIDDLRRVNAERRAADQRDLDEAYHNYLPPIV
jgi:hypothetical protein